jgi:hypothetical protein
LDQAASTPIDLILDPDPQGRNSAGSTGLTSNNHHDHKASSSGHFHKEDLKAKSKPSQPASTPGAVASSAPPATTKPAVRRCVSEFDAQADNTAEAISDLGRAVSTTATVGAHPIAGMDTDPQAAQGHDSVVRSTASSNGNKVSSEYFHEIKEEQPVTATAITRDDLEEEVRKKLMSEVVTAEVIGTTTIPASEPEQGESSSTPKSNHGRTSKKRKKRICLLALGLLVLVGVGVGLIVAVTSKDDEPKEEDEAKEEGEPVLTEQQQRLLAFLQERSPRVTDLSSPQNKAFQWLSRNNRTQEDDHILETYALCTLYHSTRGDEWTNSEFWLDDSESVCEWFPGNMCEMPNRRSLQDDHGKTNITILDLSSNNLVGELPSELQFMSDLKVLQFGFNQLEGTLPTFLDKLSNLQVFDVQDNGFLRSIPTSYGDLKSLIVFNIGINKLSGSIPTEIGALTNLENFHAPGNDLTGKVPVEIEYATRLKEIVLSKNNLEGSIPTELAQLTDLEVLKLTDNKLGLNLPSVLGNLTQLVEFDVSNNELTGTVPRIYANWASIGTKKRTWQQQARD